MAIAGTLDAAGARAADRPGRVREPFNLFKFCRNAAVIALAITLGVLVGRNAYFNLVPKNLGVVEEGRLYRSGELTTESTKRVVQAHGIRTIVDLGAHDPGTPEEALAQRTAEALGVTRYRFPLFGDGTGDPNEYVRALRVIFDPANQPVLVHCAAGAQRTSMCVVLYRNIAQGVPIDEAYAEALEYRHDPLDNPKLKPMIDTWAGAIADSLRTGDEIEYTGGKKD
jgi:protein tyrosine/serine phosphatase